MYRVVIVGRPNVGKSSLFNRLLGRRRAIVHDQPGVTRDAIAGVVSQAEVPFELLDTGGIGDAPDPDFAKATERAAQAAMEMADFLLFVVDGRAGLTPLDQQLALRVRQLGKPTLLIVNKVDERKHQSFLDDFYQLGWDLLAVSAAHGVGVKELVSITEQKARIALAEEKKEEKEIIPRLAIVGRPNVGKSSLLNHLLGEERQIVSDIAGTTRDAVDAPCSLKGKPYILVDTAGLRHRSRPDTSVEVFSAMRSQEAIRRADLGILVLDATEGVTSQDQRIAGMLQESCKATLILANKWDLMRKDDGGRSSQREAAEQIRAELFFVDYAPIICLSAHTGKDIYRFLEGIEKVSIAAQLRIGTGELNRFFHEVWEHQPPPLKSGRRLKLLYATQVPQDIPHPFAPPEILLFVNDEKLLTESYRRYLLNVLRAQWGFEGLPILLKVRGRSSKEKKRAGDGSNA